MPDIPSDETLIVTQGADYKRAWPVAIGGVPVVDFTGWEVKSQCRNQLNGKLLWEWSTFTQPGGIGQDSYVGIQASAEETLTWSGWPQNVAVWDMVLTIPGVGVIRPFRGVVRLFPAVTHG